MLTGAIVGLAVMMIVFYVGGESNVGTTLLNVAVFGAMISYMFQSLSFILLRIRKPNMQRPYRSPFGMLGAMVTIVIAAVTLYYQFQDPTYKVAMQGAAAWYALGIFYFAVFGRHRLVLSPEEEFAMTGQAHHL
ncbi:MAG: amino acid permease [Alphaproteobacteria bacterium]